ncbi:MAG: hypothetical protein GY788_28750 [bacterium]|nr:hypothetical protein [bacterium]
MSSGKTLEVHAKMGSRGPAPYEASIPGEDDRMRVVDVSHEPSRGGVEAPACWPIRLLDGAPARSAIRGSREGVSLLTDSPSASLSDRCGSSIEHVESARTGVGSHRP